MNQARPPETPEHPAPRCARVRAFFVGAGLPAFLLGAAAIYETFLLLLVFAPAEAGWLGGFAQEFRIWCFQYDPRTGGMDWSSVGMMLLEPLFVLGAALFLWRKVLPTFRALRGWLGHWRAVLAGIGVASLASASLFALGRPVAEELPPFPGERIRTALTVPAYQFVDHTGAALTLGDLRGRVVLVTGVYALCSTACPQILIETRRLLDELPADARARTSVVALTLNPEYETTAIMAGVASGYGFTHPEFRYVTGEVAAMNEALERLQFSRFRNADTGVIEHANLYLLIDPGGRIAYRFNTGPRHAPWVREALISLAREAVNAP